MKHVTVGLRGTRLLAATLVAGVAVAAHAQNLSDRFAEVAKMRQEAASQDVTGARLLGALLYTDITVEFKDTKVKDAIDFIANALGVPLVARYQSDRIGTGIDPEMEVTLKVDGKPALNVLEMILEQVSVDTPATWQLRGSFIEVGTKDRLSVPAAREVRLYPIRDLIFEPPLFDNAPNFNLNQAIQQGNNGRYRRRRRWRVRRWRRRWRIRRWRRRLRWRAVAAAVAVAAGGGIFGDPGEAPDAVPEEERAQKIIDIITESIEPDAWLDIASIRYYQGVLIIRAPDYIQRQIGGYPFAAAPRRDVAQSGGGGRYVTFSAPFSVIENVQFRPVTVTGAAGGGGFGTGGGNNPAPPASGNNSGGSGVPPTKPSGGNGGSGGGSGGGRGK
jgi:hypothetical protein